MREAGKGQDAVHSLGMLSETLDYDLQLSIADFDERVDALRAQLGASSDDRDLLDELALATVAASTYRDLSMVYLGAALALEPAAGIGRQQVEAVDKAVAARVSAVAGRIEHSYGQAAADLAAVMRRDQPSCSRASIARALRDRKDSGGMPHVRLPANDRTIEVQLRKMGF